MRYVSLLLVLIVTVVFHGCSKSPKGFYITPEHKDIGVVRDDDRTGIVKFEIFNGLDKAVKIKQLLPSCTCSNAQLSENPIPSGGSSTLTVTVRFLKQPGKQDFTVMLLTDSVEFPHKQVSLTAWIPATGTYQKSLTIGNFYAGAELESEFPTDLFSRGSVEYLGVVSENNSDGISIRLADNANGKAVLVVKGTVPHKVGVFTKTLQFRESISGDPSLGEGILELQLAGRIVPCWVVKPDLYLGFVSLSKSQGNISVVIESNPDLSSLDRMGSISTVSAEFGAGWLSLISQSASPDRIELHIKIHKGKLEQLGANQSPMKLTINYDDGRVESYTTNLFVRLGS